MTIHSLGNAQIRGDREEQQDYFASFNHQGLDVLLVADGMGGHQGGAVASEQVAKTFIRQFKANPEPDIPQRLLDALQAANEHIARLSREGTPQFSHMGTTLLVLVLAPNRAYWLSVGDSPLYHWNGLQLLRLNANHSLAEDLERAAQLGLMTMSQARNHPSYHILTSAVNGNAIPLVDCPKQGIPLKPPVNRFLLASDGIHTLPDTLILQLLTKADDAQRVSDDLITRIDGIARPAQDNATVLTVFL